MTSIDFSLLLTAFANLITSVTGLLAQIFSRRR